MWKNVLKVLFVVGCLVVGWMLGAGLGAGRIRDLQKQQLDAQRKYESDLGRLTGQLADAKEQAVVAVQSSRDAESKLASLRAGIGDFVQQSGEFNKTVRDGLSGDIDLVDQCITDLDRYEAGLHQLYSLSQKN